MADCPTWALLNGMDPERLIKGSPHYLEGTSDGPVFGGGLPGVCGCFRARRGGLGASCGAFLVLAAWRKEPDWAVLAAWVTSGAVSLGGRVKAAPRRATAVTGMGGGLALLPAGLGMCAGAGGALTAGGGVSIGGGGPSRWGARAPPGLH